MIKVVVGGEHAERVLIVGGTGTGKTTMVRRFLYPAIPRAMTTIVVDPKEDKIWRDLPTLRWSRFGFLNDVRPGTRAAFRFPGEHADQSTDGLAHDPRFVAFARKVFKQGNMLLIMDETADMFRGPHTMHPSVARLIRMGRQKGIAIWWLIQRPSDVPMMILTESQCAAAFTLRYIEDRRKMAKAFGDALMLPPDPGAGENTPHRFWWVRNNNKPEIVELRLRGKGGIAIPRGEAA